MKEVKFYRCKHCGNIIVKLIDSKVPVKCCGENMEEIIPNSTECAQEKHIPTVNRVGNVVMVCVSDVIHPMTEKHLINFVLLHTANGYYVKEFVYTDEPKCEFMIKEDEEVINVYAYCNLHGLWKNC